MQRLSQDEVLSRFVAKHGDRYDYSEVRYVNSHTKVKIKCEHHGHFYITPIRHINKAAGCQKCARSVSAEKRTYTLEELIQKFKEIHSNNYLYDCVEYVGFHKKITVICKKHGEFKISAKHHLSGSGCKQCSNKEKSEKMKISFETFIDQVIKIHGDFYDYSKVLFQGLKYKIDIICPKHGIFKQSAYSHYHGYPCKQCSAEKKPQNQPKSTEQFIKDAVKVHGNRYDYSLAEYKNNHIKVAVICRLHGKFFITPRDHINGEQNCSKCSTFVSKKEKHWLDELKIPEKFRQYKIKCDDGSYMKVDACKPRNKIVFEFLGGYWHGDLRIFDKNDMNKRANKTFGQLHKETFARFRKLRKLGYTVVYIWEHDWKKQK